MAGKNEWRKVLRKQRTSGKSVAAFCRERGINENTYQYWRSKLKDEMSPGKFVRVGAESQIEVELPGGAKVKIPADSLAATLKRTRRRRPARRF